MRKLFAYWQRGVGLVLFYGLGMFAAFTVAAVVVVLLNAALGLVGWGIPESQLDKVLAALALVWAPIGVGTVDRYRPDVPERSRFRQPEL